MRRDLQIFFCVSFLTVGYHRSISQELPQVIHPTPEAASLFKFMDYPVDFSTGIPQITIPIYEVKSGSLSLPISISYHSSGRKVYDETGAIGLGWTLVAGGMISRTIYGDPDDNDNIIKFPSPWKKQEDIGIDSAGARFLEGVYENTFPISWFDTEYDFFSYSANSIAGKFVLRDDNNIKTAVLIPKKPYKVDYHKATVQGNINYFDFITITDDGGVIYRFGKSLKDGAEYYETAGIAAKNSWMLTEIVSADKNDTISFKYQTFSKTKRTVSQSTTIIDQNFDCSPGIWYDVEITDDNLGTFQDTNLSIQRIVEIVWKHGKVKFDLSEDGDMIANIQVEDSKHEIIKLIDLRRSSQDALSDGNPPTFRLDSVIIMDAQGRYPEIFEFEYYPTIYPQGVLSVDGRFRDMWGYYNASGQLDMRPYIENIEVQYSILTQYRTIGNPGFGRAPNLAAAKSGVLKKIIFPTGGFKEFEYEQNKYGNANTSGGGLRLYRSVSDAGDGIKLYRTYKYGLNEEGFGILNFTPNVYNMSTETKHQNYVQVQEHKPRISYRSRVYSADVLPIFLEFRDRPIYYPAVTEYLGTEDNNLGKTIYRYDQGSPTFPSSVQNLFVSADLKEWKHNALLEKQDFKNVEGNYVPVHQTTNEYLETTYPDEKIWGLHVGKYFFITPQDLVATNGHTVPSYFPENVLVTCLDGGHQPEIFRFSDYTISVGKKELIRTVEKSYDESGVGTISADVEYEYNNNHLLHAEKRIGSQGESVVTESKYPFDFPGEAVHTEMVNRNMINYPVELNRYRDSLLVSSTKTSYRQWDVYAIKPEVISVRQGNQPYEARIGFLDYDSYGNIRALAKDGGPVISYTWGYSNALPIAETKNAELKEETFTINASHLAHKSISENGSLVPFGNSFESFTNQSISPALDLYVIGGSSTPPSQAILTVYLFKSGSTTPSKSQSCSWGENDLGSISLTPGVYQWYYDAQVSGGSNFTGYNLYVTTNYATEKTRYNIFHTSFEDDGVISTDAKTGKKIWPGVYSVNLAGYSGEYKLSYWKKSGQGPWFLIQQTLNGIEGVTQSFDIGAEGSYVDEVRLQPTGSIMTTYTYEPLIGMTSATDSNQLTTEYEYDTVGRLEIVRDSDGNIVKRYKYHYQNQD